MPDHSKILADFILLVRKLRLAQVRERDLLERVLAGNLDEVKELRRISNICTIARNLEGQVDSQVYAIARDLATVTDPAPEREPLVVKPLTD